MNKIEALNEKALEAAHVAYETFNKVGALKTNRLKDEHLASVIRAYLTASDAEREPVAWASPDSIALVCGEKIECSVFLTYMPHDEYTMALYAAPLPITALEAENTRLKAEVERLRELASELPIVKYALRATEARLAEALKALEPVDRFAEEFLAKADAEGWRETNLVGALFSIAELRAARRVREGGKVDD